MTKRELDDDIGDRPPKRPRPTQTVQADQPVEQITSSRQLQQLLSFQQDNLQQLRHGISSCKAFLDEIVYNPQDDNHKQRLALLRQYLDGEKPKDQNDLDRPFFTQLWQAWSFANSSNGDHLSSAICSHFALLLKALSALVDFREYGRLLSRTVLQFQHLRLIKRCLDAPKHKEFLIAPALRLLTEVTQFDGGAFAHEVYKHREQTFDQKVLQKCLTIVKSNQSEEDIIRRPAVRTIAVRYILSHLRLQDEGGKIDILKQRPICQTLFSYFRIDPPDVILDILHTTENNVFKDAEIPRFNKAGILSQLYLEKVLEIATRAEVPAEVSKEAVAWLKAVCSKPAYGILRTSGWYPQDTTHIDTRSTFDSGALDLGLESLEFWEDEEKFQVKNAILASWIQTLRPNSDLKEREIILTSFRSAPELVHAYFKDSTLQMDPRMTNTWIGYASFLFEVVNLPLPLYAGNIDATGYAALPPQTSIVLDNIFPKPLTQKIMTRCLNQTDKLISFFIVRTLVVALDKIGRLREEYRIAGEQSPRPELWREARKLLDTALSHSVPPFKDVVSLYRRLGNDSTHHLQREATTRLTRHYLTLFPTLTSEENIDVSSALISALEASKEVVVDGKPAWNALELENLIVVAQSTSDVRWFQKHGSLSVAPVIAMLKICAAGGDSTLRSLVSDILDSEGMLAVKPTSSDFAIYDAFVHSLQDRSDHVWSFLEQCMLRATKAPVKYLDEVDLLAKGEVDGQILLAAVLLEQAPFIMTKSKDEQKDVMKWINALFKLWSQAGCDTFVKSVKVKIDAIDGWDTKTGAKVKLPETPTQQQAIDEATTSTSTEDKLSVFTPPPAEARDHPELYRWQKKDLDNALDDHDIDDLMLCLCSEHDEIRKQARTQLSNLMAKVLESELEEKVQLYITLGELLETYDQSYRASDTKLPYLAGTFAVHVAHVQHDPTHFLYAKINDFLMKSPEWRMSKLPSFWLHSSASSMPSEDDAYWKEVQWTLDWLVDGLRTQADLELLRRAGAFERLMVLYASPAAPDKLVRQRILELVYRAALMDPMTLITRTGVLSWLGMLKGEIAAALRRYILEHSDGERLKSWTAAEQVV